MKGDMDIRPLPAEESAVRRFVTDLWIPYNRDLAAKVEAHALAEDVDLVAEQTTFRLERLESEHHRVWIAVEDGSENDDDAEGAGFLAETDGDLVGFITADVDESPSVFVRPDRIAIGDVFVRAEYRGTGLAQDLQDEAVEYADEMGCDELVLDVDVDNERAIAFYEKGGFEPYRYRMRTGVGDVRD